MGSDRQLRSEGCVRSAQGKLGGLAVDLDGLDGQVPRVQLERLRLLEHLDGFWINQYVIEPRNGGRLTSGRKSETGATRQERGFGGVADLHIKGDGALHNALAEIYIDLQMQMRRSNLPHKTHITHRPPGITPLAHLLNI